MRNVRLAGLIALVALPGCGESGPPEPQDFVVDGHVALASLLALSDGHLQQVANHFQVLAPTEEARSANWERIQHRLADVEQVNVPGLFWYALPNGSYWSLEQGQAAGNLADRAYWPGLMAGQVVLGDLVASRATGKCAAIVAVPVRDENGNVVAVLGASVYLDSLSLLLKREIGLQPGEIFFSVDATPIGALQDDPDKIFLDPYNLGEPELEAAIREMLAGSEGVVNYSFRGKRRTVLYQKSAVTGWWYAFGRVWE